MCGGVSTSARVSIISLSLLSSLFNSPDVIVPVFSSPSLSHSLCLAHFYFSPFLLWDHEAHTNMDQQTVFTANISDFFAGSNFLLFLLPKTKLWEAYIKLSPVPELVLSCVCTMKHLKIHRAWKILCKAKHSLSIIKVRLVCLLQQRNESFCTAIYIQL